MSYFWVKNQGKNATNYAVKEFAIFLIKQIRKLSNIRTPCIKISLVYNNIIPIY